MEIGVQVEASTEVAPKHKIWSVSPSQIDAYKRCPRVWYNSYVLKDRQPEAPHMKRGTDIHKAIEIYLLRSEVLPVVEGTSTLEFVQAAIPHLPRPITDTEHWGQYPKDENGVPTGMLLVEQKGELGTFQDGPNFNQYIDNVEALPTTCRIIDYKTTSDFRYCKTPEELQTNFQLCANAKFIFSISDYEEIEIGHLYLLAGKGRPKAKPVFTRVNRAMVDAVWAQMMVTVREMLRWAALGPPDAQSLPPNTDSCDMYGGCYYRKKCGFDVQKIGFKPRMDPMSETRTNSLLADLIAGAQKAVPDVATTAALTLGGGGLPKSDKPADLAALLNAKKDVIYEAPSLAPAPPAVAAAPEVPPLFAGAVKAAEGLRERLGAARAAAPSEAVASIVPPDAPPDTSTPEEVEAANASKAEAEVAAKPAAEGEKKKGRPKKQLQIEMAPEAPEAAAVGETTNGLAKEHPPAPEAPPVVAPTGLDTTKINTKEPSPPPPADVLTDIDKLRQILSTPDPQFECGCKMLFIDAMPSHGWRGEQPTDLASIMHAFEKLATQSAKQPDYRMIRYESKGYLALSMKALMRGLPASVYVNSTLPGADVFLSVVTPYVEMIFKGTR